MTQITLTLDESEQAQALVRYLESLDFVKVEATSPERPPKRGAAKAAKQMSDFLKTLPSRFFWGEECSQLQHLS